jgi:hypothetical protein
MANSSPARPAHRDVTGFGEFQQTLELRVPGNRKPGASKGDSWKYAIMMHLHILSGFLERTT